MVVTQLFKKIINFFRITISVAIPVATQVKLHVERLIAHGITTCFIGCLHGKVVHRNLYLAGMGNLRQSYYFSVC